MDQAASKKILWVEDDNLISVILSGRLISAGFNIAHTTNGDEAMRILEGMTPDAILMDLLLPGMSGLDIIEKIRGIERLKDVPVIILSNLNDSKDMKRAHDLGVKAFLVKAVSSVEQIIKELESVLK